MKQIFIGFRDLIHYVKGKKRFLFHAKAINSGIEYYVENDFTNDSMLVLIYFHKDKTAQIRHLQKNDYFIKSVIESLELKAITKRDFNMQFMETLFGITNIIPFENEDKTAN
jgi:hypothetical protein